MVMNNVIEFDFSNTTHRDMWINFTKHYESIYPTIYATADEALPPLILYFENQNITFECSNDSNSFFWTKLIFQTEEDKIAFILRYL